VAFFVVRERPAAKNLSISCPQPATVSQHAEGAGGVMRDCCRRDYARLSEEARCASECAVLAMDGKLAGAALFI